MPSHTRTTTPSTPGSRPTGARTVCAWAAGALLATSGLGVLAAAPALAASAGPVAPHLSAAATAATGLPVHEATLHDRMMPAGSPDAAPESQAASAARPVVRAGAAADLAVPVQLGLDEASYQHPGGAGIDWRAVAASGRRFAIVKATESSYTNPYLPGDLAGAHAAGLTVGAYTFARPQYPAGPQADALAAAVRGMPSPSIPPVLDLEDSGGLDPVTLVAWTHTFLDRFQAQTGRLAMIYSGPGFWSSAMGGSTDFTRYPLWEAHYTSAAAPAPMGGWPTYRFWQFSSSGNIPGIVGAVDEDRFPGSLTDLSSQSSVDPIQAEQQQLGGDAGWLGPATGQETAVAGGTSQTFRGGTVYWSAGTGAHVVHGAVLVEYLGLGGPGGLAGFPTTDENGTPDGLGRYNHFSGASIYWSAATGVHEVHGAIRVEWAATGWEAGPLGYPVTDELLAADGVGRTESFSRGGTITWSPATGVHEVHGAVRSEWLATGAEHGLLGYPTTDETRAADGVGRYNHFSAAASIFWSPTTGAHEVHGAIRAVWAAGGWQTGAAGYPTSDEYATSTGRAEDFQKAVVSWNSTTGAVTVRLR